MKTLVVVGKSPNMKKRKGECRGHPAGTNGVMGQTVYCDGSCQVPRTVRGKS